MIAIPKPKYFERKKPAEQSEDEFFDEICNRQLHLLRSAIERVILNKNFKLEKIFITTIARLSICYGSSWYFDAQISSNRL